MTVDNTNKLKKLSPGSAHSVRFKNWSVIAEIIRNFGVEVDDDKIFSLSNEENQAVLYDLLHSIYSLSCEMTKRTSSDKAEDSETIEKAKEKKFKSDAVNITNINPFMSLTETENTLEFFIISISKYLDMKPRQAVALLSNNRKYLLFLVSKGIKGDFTSIIAWYQAFCSVRTHEERLAPTVTSIL
jgi:hypothetical protein